MSAKVIRLLVALLAVGLCTGVYAAVNPSDLLLVNFSQEVVVGDKILPVGTWEFRWDGSKVNPTMKIYRDDAKNVEIVTTTIPTPGNEKMKESSIVLEKIGPDFHLTKIWIKAERKGFLIPTSSLAASLPHGEVRTYKANFESASRFVQDAPMEGQARSHNAQGLGFLDDNLHGIVLARNYTIETQQEVAVAQVVIPAPPQESLRIESLTSTTETLKVAPETSSVRQTEVIAPEPIVSTPEVAQIEPVIAPQETVQIAQTSEEPAIEQPAELAAASPVEEPVAEPEQQQEVFDGALPATASNWLAFVVIGIGLIGLSFMVRRS